MPHNPFHGLMQPGQRPSMQFQQLNQAYQSDPRRILGQALMGQGASSAPVRTPLQGLGRLSSALVGAYLQRKAGDAQAAREDEFRTQISGALGNIDMSETPMLAALGGVDPLGALTAGASMEASAAQALAQRQPKAPVSMYLPDTREVKLVEPGSMEQEQAAAQGFRLGNPPDAPTGFQYNQSGNLTIIPNSDQAFARGEKFTKTPRELEKKFDLANTAFREATDLAQDASGASDAGLIYKFFSALDPGGRVTDQEAMLAQTSASLGQQFAQKLRQGLKSGLIAPETRAEIVETMRGLVTARQDALQKLMPSIEAQLKPLGFTPQTYFPFYNKFMGPLPTVAATPSNNNQNIIPGQTILPADQTNLDPSIANESDSDLLGGIF